MIYLIVFSYFLYSLNCSFTAGILSRHKTYKYRKNSCNFGEIKRDNTRLSLKQFPLENFFFYEKRLFSEGNFLFAIHFLHGRDQPARIVLGPVKKFDSKHIILHLQTVVLYRFDFLQFCRPAVRQPRKKSQVIRLNPLCPIGHQRSVCYHIT